MLAPLNLLSTPTLGPPARGRVWRLLRGRVVADADGPVVTHPGIDATFGIDAREAVPDGETIVGVAASSAGATIAAAEPNTVAFDNRIDSEVPVGKGVFLRIAGATEGRRIVTLELSCSDRTTIPVECRLSVVSAA